MTEQEAIQLHISENIHRIEVIEDFLSTNSDANDKECRKNIDILTKINKALEEVQQYRAIGTPEECRAAVEKQTAKKPKHTLIKHGKHTWRKNENGEVDDFVWEYGNHNGVACEVCGETVCVLCNPEYDELTDCEEEYWICPSCGKKIYFKYKCCDCGQVINWSDEE